MSTSPAHAAHHDGYYVRIWAILCVLLTISIVGPMIGIRLVTLITAFGIAIVKAYLVTKHFMHLNIEKRWVTWILVAMIAFMVVMFGGVAPDVMKHTGHHWDKDYVEPALVHEEHGE
jgi:caa(3)-type oxidase subunit IV